MGARIAVLPVSSCASTCPFFTSVLASTKTNESLPEYGLTTSIVTSGASAPIAVISPPPDRARGEEDGRAIRSEVGSPGATGAVCAATGATITGRAPLTMRDFSVAGSRPSENRCRSGQRVPVVALRPAGRPGRGKSAPTLTYIKAPNDLAPQGGLGLNPLEVTMNPSMERTLRVSAWLACAMVVGMIAIFLLTGVGQDPLQFVHPVEEYGRILLRNPAALRACLALDNGFIVLYSTVFLTLGVILLRLGQSRALTLVATGLLLGLGLLDMIENFHFMVMLAGAEQGIFPSAVEISLQVFESLFKFHVSYLGLFLLGLVLPRRNARERLLANLSLFVQLPVGILIYVTPAAVAFPLVFVRFLYFLAALALVSGIEGPCPSITAPRAAVG